MNESKPETSGTPVTRRDFLKSSSGAVVGSTLLGGLTIERSAWGALSPG
ncbi:MAG: hypothetical protein DME26_22275, partial [Verrucomicrobia bacterium]